MSKNNSKIRTRVFLADKRGLMQLAYGLITGTSTTYTNFKFLPVLAESLSDTDLEQLTREIMRIMDIGAIESAMLKKQSFVDQAFMRKQVEDFKSLDVSQYLPGNCNE